MRVFLKKKRKFWKVNIFGINTIKICFSSVLTVFKINLLNLTLRNFIFRCIFQILISAHNKILTNMKSHKFNFFYLKLANLALETTKLYIIPNFFARIKYLCNACQMWQSEKVCYKDLRKLCVKEFGTLFPFSSDP